MRSILGLLLLVALTASGDATGDAWSGFKSLSGSRAGQTVDGIGKLKSYLRGLGYIDPSQLADLSDLYDDCLVSAVTLYQQNFHLQVTGTITDETLRQIMTPRCGVPDIVNGTNTMAIPIAGTVAHFSFFPGRPQWPRNKILKYAFLPKNKDMIDNRFKSVFANAFARWKVDAAISLDFVATEDYANADIKIGFYAGDAGDGDRPFDGPGGPQVIHYTVPTDGHLNLDKNENWVVDGDVTKAKGVFPLDLETVLMHSIGHLIGLNHSADVTAVMYPAILPKTRKVALSADDIRGARVLYRDRSPLAHNALNTIRTAGGNGSVSGGVTVLLRWWWSLLAVATFAIF